MTCRPLAALVAVFWLAAATPAAAQTGLEFNGVDQYVTFGPALDLGTPTFTIEVWFRRDGPGATGSSGSGGVTAVPLLTKGRNQGDGGLHDVNYYLGIRGTDSVLVADYEEGTGQVFPGKNHPIVGVTRITPGTWHHAAATFDGTTWKLYLDGNLESQLAVGAGRLPQWQNDQHAGLATAMTSTGVAEGFFKGALDEARIWNYARTQAEIQSTMNQEVTSAAGLLARWGLNEGTGSTAFNSVAGSDNGTLMSAPVWAPGSPFAPPQALDLGGSGGYVSFGSPTGLRLSTFTIELWLRRDGPGVGTDTGVNGIPDAIPVFARGAGDDGTSGAINYLFGIRASDGVLCADLEEGTGGTTPGLNHPIAGARPLGIGEWHHVAATYDGNTWRLYLDGNIEDELAVGEPAASGSTVGVALGSALKASGVAGGYFDGVVDEVRVWNYARTQSQIQAAGDLKITNAQTGLVARWSLDEGSSNTVYGSAGTAITGTLAGTAWAWAPGAPFNLNFNQAVLQPVLVSPAHQGTNVPMSPSLNVSVSDPDSDGVTVTYYGRPVPPSLGPDFTLIGLPDTQYYVAGINGGTPAMFTAQTQWIVDNIASRNIVYTVHLGDCVEEGDNDPSQWPTVNGAMSLIENPATTGLPQGMPYGVCVGNHDQSPVGEADGTTTLYNQYFGVSRFQGRSYYGGHFGTSNDNWFDLFAVGSLQFVVVSLEYDTTPDANVLAWADQLLTTYASRRAIVVSHSIINNGDPADFGVQGQAIYETLKGHPNLFLMLCGHVPGEGRRQDTYNGRTVYTLLSDYQGRANGGGGWLRIMEFSPANSAIRVKTYSPWLGQYEADASSEFSFAYDMSNSSPFQLLGTVGPVASGSTASITWPGLAPNTAYEWYAVASDGSADVTGQVWRFTTAPPDVTPPSAQVLSPNGGEVLRVGQVTPLTWSASDNLDVASVDLLLSRSGLAGTYETIAAGIANSGFYAWTVSVPATSNAFFKVVARDAASNAGEDASDAAFEIKANQTITATAGSGGTISPSGPVAVPFGGSQTFFIAADTCCAIANVLVDGASVGPVGSYTFENVQADHTIAASFADLTPPVVLVQLPNGNETFAIDQVVSLAWQASDGGGVATVDLLISRSGPAGPFETLATGVANSGSYPWTTTGPVTMDAYLKVVAHDSTGNDGDDLSDAAFLIYDAAAAEGQTITAFALGPVAPNPSRGIVRLRWEVPRTARVRIDVLDVQGRIVDTIVDADEGPGRYEARWTASSRHGRTPAGLYLVRMRAPGVQQVRRFLAVP